MKDKISTLLNRDVKYNNTSISEVALIEKLLTEGYLIAHCYYKEGSE